MADLDAASTPAAARAAFRAGQVRPTCGVAQGYAQANLMILPKEQAFDFLLFAQRNPKPCPLLEVMEPGVTEPATAPGAKIRFRMSDSPESDKQNTQSQEHREAR